MVTFGNVFGTDKNGCFMFFGEKSHGKSNKKPLFILISPLYGFDEPSFKKVYQECIEGN